MMFENEFWTRTPRSKPVMRPLQTVTLLIAESDPSIRMPAGEVVPAALVLMIEKPLRSIVTLFALTRMPSLVDDPLSTFAVRKYDPGVVSVVPKVEIGVRGSI